MSASEIQVELFTAKCASITSELRRAVFDVAGPIGAATAEGHTFSKSLQPYVAQFDLNIRKHAELMAEPYKLFHMLENDIRRLIVETLETAHGTGWWNHCVPTAVRTEAENNRKRENEAGYSLRSELLIDYITFGQLGDIIRANWADFAGMLSNQPALSRVLHSLNMSRGTIAHCGLLREDEIDRLELSVRDWFRVLAGPAA